MSLSHRCNRKQLLHLLAATLGTVFYTTTLTAQSTSHELASPPPDAGAKVYSIAGALIDSETHAPVAGATMEIAETTHLNNKTETDVQGRFTFAPVPAGKYTLTAVLSGYITQTLNEHNDTTTAIVTGENQDTTHIQFRIDPEAAIRVHITDEAGEPVNGAHVTVKRLVTGGGYREHLRPVTQADVDDMGDLEVASLHPGRYLLAVQARPWFAVHPSPNKLPAGSGPSNLDVVYPITYYGGATSESSATALTIRGGETTAANIVLHAVPAVHLTLRIPHPEGVAGGRPEFKQTILLSDVPVEPDLISEDASAAEYVVSPGHYVIEGGSPRRLAEIDVTGDVTVDLASALTTTDVTATLMITDGHPLADEPVLFLATGKGLPRGIRGLPREESKILFPAVPAGDWNVLAKAGETWLDPLTLQCGSTIARGEIIHLTGNQTDCIFRLQPAQTRIEGFVARNGTGPAGLMVMLVPNDPALNEVRFFYEQTNTDGSFFLVGAPGKFTIVALRNGWDLPWAEAGVIDKYLAGGIPLTIPNQQPPLIKLTVPIPVQDQ